MRPAENACLRCGRGHHGELEDAKVPLENYEKLVEGIRVWEVRLTFRSTRGLLAPSLTQAQASHSAALRLAPDPWETPLVLADHYANQDFDAFGKGRGREKA